MEDVLILTVRVKGQNIMSNPLLQADGIALISGKLRDIKVETPITSIPDFVDAFEGLFKEEEV